MSIDRKSYTFTPEEMRVIGGFYILPHDARLEEMRKFFAGRGPEEIMSMFSNFIDMAATVIENTEEHVTLMAVALWGAHPHDAEKMNLPSILGAINGLKISEGVSAHGLCNGCAYRKGSVANTCLTTTWDANYCHENKEPFMCHEGIPEGDTPVAKCRGFLKKEKRNAA